MLGIMPPKDGWSRGGARGGQDRFLSEEESGSKLEQARWEDSQPILAGIWDPARRFSSSVSQAECCFRGWGEVAECAGCVVGSFLLREASSGGGHTNTTKTLHQPLGGPQSHFERWLQGLLRYLGFGNGVESLET